MSIDNKELLLVLCSESLLPNHYRNSKKTAKKIAEEVLGKNNKHLIFEITSLISDFILFYYQKKPMDKSRRVEASKYLIRRRLRSYSFVAPKSKKQIEFFSKKFNITEKETVEFMGYVRRLSEELKKQLP